MTIGHRRYLLNRNQRRRLSMTGAAALLVVASLAGCGGAGTDAEKAPTVTAAPTQSAPPVETVAATPAPAPEPESVPEKTYPEPETLRGLDADGLAGLLGAPRFKRRDDPAEIWQYLGDACALDVFLYRAGDVYRVRHFETRGPGRTPVDQNDCFVSLLKAREQGRAG